MATIDSPDRRFILMLNDQAATFRRLAEVAVAPKAAAVYLQGMLSYERQLDSAIQRAIGRSA